jgi:hypothetical protein
MRRNKARRGGTLECTRWRGELVAREVDGKYILPFQTHASRSILQLHPRLQKSTRLPCCRRHFRGVIPVANLADPTADIACEVLENSSQPVKLQSTYQPISMGPLPASSARLALRQSPHVPSTRLSQVQRHFSTTSPVRKEIQDAYILSAARTPTGKVREYHTIVFYIC